MSWGLWESLESSEQARGSSEEDGLKVGRGLRRGCRENGVVPSVEYSDHHLV